MQLEAQIGPNEQLLWSGKKDKKVSFWETVFNPLMPFAAIWGFLDFAVIRTITQGMRYESTEIASQTGKFLIPFFMLHLLPVWLYLGGVLTAAREAKNSHFCVTDQAIYIQSGVFKTTNERFAYSQVLGVGTEQSFFDRKANTGDVCITLDQIIYTGKHHRATQRVVKIENVADYEDVYRMVMQYQPQFASSQPANVPQNAFQQPFAGMAGFEQAAQSRTYQRYMNAQQQKYGGQQAPQYGSQPQYGGQQAPQYGSQPQQPAQPPSQEMDSLESLSAPDEFHDPTLSAFDFQKNDPFDNSGF